MDIKDKVFLDLDDCQFNIIYNDKLNQSFPGKFKEIKWLENHMKFFAKIEKIDQGLWIQIYDVYLDKLKNVTAIGFRLTPNDSGEHVYPIIQFKKDGTVKKTSVERDKKMISNNFPESFKIVEKFYNKALEEDIVH